MSKSEIVAECWTCISASTKKPLDFVHAGCIADNGDECPGVEYHRLIGHDVRPVREKGKA